MADSKGRAEEFDEYLQKGGYRKNVYTFNGHEATVIEPKTACEPRYWVWRAEFLADFNYADRALLKKGWHIAYYSISDMFGCPEAVELMKKFHDDVTEKFHLNKKADIFGFSRGGLYASNYTMKYPSDIATLYLDAPVLDICSWPGGFGERQNKAEWEKCCKWYKLDLEEGLNFKGSPRYNLQKLIGTKVPVLLVAGDSDTVVPYSENGAYMDAEYKKQGAKILTIIKPGIGHHPHSLENPENLVRYIEDNRKNA